VNAVTSAGCKESVMEILTVISVRNV